MRPCRASRAPQSACHPPPPPPPPEVKGTPVALTHPPPPPPPPPPAAPRAEGADLQNAARPRLRGAQTTIDLFFFFFLALTGFLSQLLLRQRGSLPVLAGSPERAGRVAAVMADVVFVAGGHSCIMVTPARPPAHPPASHPAGVPAVASSRSLFTKAFLFSSSSWLGMRPALPPSM